MTHDDENAKEFIDKVVKQYPIDYKEEGFFNYKVLDINSDESIKSFISYLKEIDRLPIGMLINSS